MRYSSTTYCSYSSRRFWQWVTSLSFSWPAKTVCAACFLGKWSIRGGNWQVVGLSRNNPRVLTRIASETGAPSAPAYDSMAAWYGLSLPRSFMTALRFVVSVRASGSSDSNSPDAGGTPSAWPRAEASGASSAEAAKTGASKRRVIEPTYYIVRRNVRHQTSDVRHQTSDI